MTVKIKYIYVCFMVSVQNIKYITVLLKENRKSCM
jgi:hypothetical protein